MSGKEGNFFQFQAMSAEFLHEVTEISCQFSISENSFFTTVDKSFSYYH